MYGWASLVSLEVSDQQVSILWVFYGGPDHESILLHDDQ